MKQIRKKYLDFFEKRGHKIIPSASLVPENDPSVLFNTAGMLPLVPYLLGEKHPMGERLVNVQKCIRTGDIDEVGDNRHLTFFEMLGNWSLGDYFKEKSIQWSFEFLTDKKEGLGLNKDRLYITVFEGNKEAKKDEEAFDIWTKYVDKNRIYFLPAEDNWWEAGDSGPCGPDTEIFYDINEEPLGDLNREEFIKANKEGKVVEIWNNVFMQYEKKEGKIVGFLKNNNVDTGVGLERISMVVEKKKDIFEIEIFKLIIEKIREESEGGDERIEKIIADHLRAVIFMIGDGVLFSNTAQGYVLRRLFRRVIRFSFVLNFTQKGLEQAIDLIVDYYKETYPEVIENRDIILEEIRKEKKRFEQTLERGLREFEKGTDPFVLYTTYGFPIELSQELAKERGQKIDRKDFDKKISKHQELSRTSSAGMFKGGLSGSSSKIIKLHTAHHLLLAALQELIDKDIKQRGSNITEERLRMDFSFNRKLEKEELKKVEDWVNDKIEKNLSVIKKEMTKEEAVLLGAEMEFNAKYPEVVSVYFIENEDGSYLSKEFCGGPHVKNTKEIGIFKIIKEEASSAGIRRIRAVIS